MSLINEALRRARHDAQRRDAARQGLSPPPAPGESREQPLGSIALLAVLGLAIGVGVVGGAAFFLRDGGSRKPSVAAIETQDSPRAPADRGDRTTQAVPAEPVRGSAAESAAGRGDPSATEIAAAAAPTRDAGAAAPPSLETEPPTQAETSSPATRHDESASQDGADGRRDAIAAAEVSGSKDSLPERDEPIERDSNGAPQRRDETPRFSEDESGVLVVLADETAGADADAASLSEPIDVLQRSFVRRLELADGETIELGGIAWSETGPFALMNGRVFGPGETVSGLRVVRIEPKQVELEAGGETIYLRLK